MSRMKFMNTEIDNITMDEALDKIDELILENKNAYVVTPNVDHIIKLENGGEFCDVYENANLILTDGKPLIWISKLYKTPIKEKISGSDLFPKVCELAAKKGYRMYFLGAAEGVASNAAEILMKKNPGLQVVGTYSPPIGFENDENEMNKIINQIREVKPHILILGLGSPKQELFILHNKDKLEVPISLGLGASLDFEAGRIKRAPAWMSNLGLEWLFRFFHEPKRLFKRYFIDDMKILKLAKKYRGNNGR